MDRSMVAYLSGQDLRCQRAAGARSERIHAGAENARQHAGSSGSGIEILEGSLSDAKQGKDLKSFTAVALLPRSSRCRGEVKWRCTHRKAVRSEARSERL